MKKKIWIYILVSYSLVVTGIWLVSTNAVEPKFKRLNEDVINLLARNTELNDELSQVKLERRTKVDSLTQLLEDCYAKD